MKRIAPAAEQQTESAEPRPRLLYVEDEPENWRVTEMRLRKRYDLIWARNDQEACDAIRRLNDGLYAILMDIQLQGSALDGIELTRLFRGEPAAADAPDFMRGLPPVSCAILFVTAYHSTYTEEELVQAGGDHLLTKPVDFAKLSLALANARARSALNRLTDTR